ncbi:hypothetical protein H7I53_18130 [Mycolicibacterium pulveris]|uniref:Uncharacterized protein n=1 Tax=Mycolicibacterium pulveris TaxID=36813 RepID=A0A7I7UC50_MYCPV|nr:hypothetical protein [Mycolicibacterium pulveris]MCV6982134.1 hypothetical protein [Mycolicibacterium pulveris]BBY78912.1 hypothetical protein MPUL_00700 [Mycolicibacterium pulveris]
MSEQSAADVIAGVLGDVTDWPAHEWTHEAATILAALEAAGWANVKLPAVERDQYGDPIIPVPMLQRRDGYLRIEPASENHIPARIAALSVPLPIEQGDAASFAVALLAADRWLAAAREADK